MTEPQTPEPVETTEPGTMPGWVPVLIGAILVVLAALAVFTGLRYRENTLTNIVRPRATPARSSDSAPSGEPDAGGSLVVPGAPPEANAPVSGPSRAVVTGGPGGVNATVRIWARRGMVLNVLPEDAMVTVNNVPIGEVRQLNTIDEAYDFPQAGSYTVTISAPGYKQRTFIVTAADDAKDEIARITAKLDAE